jgi:hypothetical protein
MNGDVLLLFRDLASELKAPSFACKYPLSGMLQVKIRNAEVKSKKGKETHGV